MNRKAAYAGIIGLGIVVVLGGLYVIWMGAGFIRQPAPPTTPAPAPVPAPTTRVSAIDQPDEVARGKMQAPAPAPVQPDPPGLVISGVVTTAAGAPGAGAIVAAYTPETAATRATAGDDGAFRVVGLRPGSYRMSAVLDHYNEAVVEDVNAPASNVSLVLEALSAVEGKVVDGEGKKPLVQFDVLYLKTAPGDDRHWQNIIRDETMKWVPVKNEEGKYRIEDAVSNAQFAVGARAEGFEPAYVVVPAVKPGETGQAEDLALLPEAKLLGSVVSEDRQPLSGADVYLGKEARGRTVARSNPDGKFTIGQLPPGPVTLTASHRDHLTATVEATLTRGKETEVEIMLGGGGLIQGTVLDGAMPLPNQTIMATHLQPPRVRKDGITDDSGNYTIEGLPPGEIEVIAKLKRLGEPEGAPIRLQKQAVIENGQTTVVDFQLADASSGIDGTVTTLGQPPAYALIKGYVAGESGDTFFDTVAAADGSFSIRNLPQGSAWLEVTIKLEDGHERRKNVPVQVPAGQVVRQDVQFDASATVFGSVGTMAPSEGGEVMAVMGPYTFNPAQVDIDELQRIEVASSQISEGQYKLTGLDPGTYTIIVVVFDPDETDGTGQMPTLRSTSQTVTVTGGQELRLDLVIS